MATIVLERTTFQSSRLLEFFTEEALQMQMGCATRQWPLALLKELIDNALDACETAGIPPEISMVIEEDTVSVQDNGPGMPVKTLEQSLDYLMYVSDKSHYVSPTRGQLGNALKCVWAAPYVVDGEHGEIKVETGGVTYHIAVTLDRIAQQPVLHHTVEPTGVVKNGTRITMHWPGIASSLLQADVDDFYNVDALLRRYVAFNPHATFSWAAPEGNTSYYPCQTPTWAKWIPSRPTSPHWYTVEKLRSLLAAYLIEDRATGRIRTVREFVAEFAGLKGTQKQKAVTDAAGLSGKTIEDLVDGGDIAALSVHALLAAMRQASRPIKAKELGMLGHAHLATFLEQYTAIVPESITYKKCDGLADGLPYMLEVAFGWQSTTALDSQCDMHVGLNWTPALKAPIPELPMLLGDARVNTYDPVVVLLHLACPRLEYTDRAKSTLVLPAAIRHALHTAVATVTKSWKAFKRQADRDNRIRQETLTHWQKMRKRLQYSVKDASYQVMPQAYQIASGNGAYPANARQIMYAARPLVQELTGGRCWKHSSYFTQTLLPDFLEQYPELTARWDVVFDARGHLFEPHTHYQLGLGTIEVRQYIEAWQPQLSASIDGLVVPHDVPTRGPQHRYHYALFVEKEGFNPLLAQAQIAERYDVAIMSTKGMSVTAARQLVAELSSLDVTILCLRDFDKAGFSIVHTLRTNTRRWQYTMRPNVVDLGLRLDDVEAMQLARERVAYDSRIDPRINLWECGATEAECDFLVQWQTYNGWTCERVELNAMDSARFITWLETKLQDVGVCKIVPAQAVLATAYRRMVRLSHIQRAMEAAMTTLPPDDAIPVPTDLAQQLRTAIEGTAQPWDDALWHLIRTQPRGESLSPFPSS
jgi:DNA topoisomerase VI subunit B